MKVLRTYNFLDGSPAWEDITPTGSATADRQVLFDPQTNGYRGAYVLANDGTDSYVYHTADSGAAVVVWTEGAALSGVYTKIAAFKGRPGVIMVYGPQVEGEAGAGTRTVTFEGDGYESYTAVIGNVGASGYSSANALQSEIGPSGKQELDVEILFPNDKTVTGYLHMQYGDANNAFARTYVYFYDSDDVLIGSAHQTDRAVQIGWADHHIGGLPVSNVRKMAIRLGTGWDWVHAAFDNIAITVTEPDPAAAFVAYSNDYGATWQAPVLVGDSPGALAGFDAARLGPASLAAALSQVKRATTIGGAYSDQAGAAETATCIVVPWYKIGSTSLTNNGAAPDFLMGGAFGLYKVIGGVATDITPVAGGTIEVADAITTWKGKWIAVLCDDGTDRNLYVSTDTGASWQLIGGANGCADARSVRVRRLATTPGQLLIACGTSGLKYWPGTGTELQDKSTFGSGSPETGEFFG